MPRCSRAFRPSQAPLRPFSIAQALRPFRVKGRGSYVYLTRRKACSFPPGMTRTRSPISDQKKKKDQNSVGRYRTPLQFRPQGVRRSVFELYVAPLFLERRLTWQRFRGSILILPSPLRALPKGIFLSDRLTSRGMI